MKAALPVLLLVATAGSAAPPAMPVTRAMVERRAAQMFTQADLDHDGLLGRDEYRSAVVTQARRYDPRVPTDGKGMDAAMAQFDALAKGRPGIPRNDFIAAALGRFDGGDLNHDGTITPEEAREAGAKARGEAPKKAKRN